MMDSTWFGLALLYGMAGSANAEGFASISAPTHDWGCEVLLCLANPTGPEAVAPCVPPIERLWSELAKGHAFPTCAMARGPGGRSYAQLTSRPYDPCPPGTTAIPQGEMAMLAGPMPPGAVPLAPSGATTPFVAGGTGTVYAGIGDGSSYGGWSPDSGMPPPKVCVSGAIGSQQVLLDGGYAYVNVYQTLVVANANGRGRAIDVYIDDQWWQTVRW